MQLFPHEGIRQTEIDEYNQKSLTEIEYIRDFIILHYKVTNRHDTPFWNYCREMEVPESLAHRIQLFRETGRVFGAREDLFKENSWIQVMLGQGIMPEQYHPVVDVMSDDELTRFMQGIKSRVDSTVAKLPGHQAYVEQYCKAKN
jgi:tryptophan halogenase